MKYLKTITVLVLSVVMFNCGGEKKKETEEKIKISNTETVEKTEDSNVANVVITGDDMMKFNKTEIRVKAGQKVKLTLRHIGKMDKNVMGHNVVILKQGVNPAAFAAKAATKKDSEYIPEGTTDVLAHTKLIGGGETTVIEFDAPEVGEYDFLCSFPAHFSTMKGKFIVEE